MADGGIVVWEPSDIEARLSHTDTALEAAVLAAKPGYTKAVAAGAVPRSRFGTSRPGRPERGCRAEVFVFVMGSIFLRHAGCSLMLFSGTRALHAGKEFPNSLPPGDRFAAAHARLELTCAHRIGAARGRLRAAQLRRKTYVEARACARRRGAARGRWHLAGELGRSGRAS